MVTEEASTWVLSAVAVRAASRRSSSARMSRPILAIASSASVDVLLRRTSMLVAVSLFLTRSLVRVNSASRCSTAAFSFAALATCAGLSTVIIWRWPSAAGIAAAADWYSERYCGADVSR